MLDLSVLAVETMLAGRGASAAIPLRCLMIN
jgi:hypothetical protein